MQQHPEVTLIVRNDDDKNVRYWRQVKQVEKRMSELTSNTCLTLHCQAEEFRRHVTLLQITITELTRLHTELHAQLSAISHLLTTTHTSHLPNKLLTTVAILAN